MTLGGKAAAPFVDARVGDRGATVPYPFPSDGEAWMSTGGRGGGGSSVGGGVGGSKPSGPSHDSLAVRGTLRVKCVGGGGVFGQTASRHGPCVHTPCSRVPVLRCLQPFSLALVLSGLVIVCAPRSLI